MLIGRIRKTLFRLHRNEQGQIIPLTVFGALVFTFLAALIINSGGGVTRKIEMQNAVDAAAVSGATWIARGMNIISANNVAMTEVLALIVVLKALKDTWEQGLRKAQIIEATCNALAAIPFVGAGISAGCRVYITIPKIYFQTKLTTFGPPIEMATQAGGLLWLVLYGLEGVNDWVFYTFPKNAYSEAQSVAESNRAEGVEIYPKGLPLSAPGVTLIASAFNVPMLAMPVEKRNFSDLCHPTYRGSPSDYPVALRRGYAPLQLEFFGRRYSPDRGPLFLAQDEANSAGLRFMLDMVNTTILRRILCGWLPTGGLFFPNLRRACERILTFPGAVTLESNVSRRFSSYCQGSPSSHYTGTQARPKPYLLKGAQRSTNRSTESLKSAKADLNYLGVAWGSTRSLFIPARFGNPNPQLCSYGQARVYNSTSFDLFTQDWRVKLVKADLVEQSFFAFLMGQKCAPGNSQLALWLATAGITKVGAH